MKTIENFIQGSGTLPWLSRYSSVLEIYAVPLLGLISRLT